MYGLPNFDKRFEIGGWTYVNYVIICLIISSGFDGREKLTKETKFVGSRHCITSGDFFSVIRQKGESQNGCLKKTKHSKFSEKRKNLRVSIRGYKMFVFWKIWRVLFSWNTRFEIRPFALLPSLCLLSLTHVRPMFNWLKFGIK